MPRPRPLKSYSKTVTRTEVETPCPTPVEARDGQDKSDTNAARISFSRPWSRSWAEYGDQLMDVIKVPWCWEI